MILECPECRTRYLVPDSAIGVAGRTVRCANCRHSWHQDGVTDIAAGAAGAAGAAAEVAARSATPSMPAPVAPVPVAPAPPSPGAALPPAAAAIDASGRGDGYDAFAHRPPFRARRNPAKRWTIAAIAAGVLMLVGVGALLWMGAPGLAQQLGLPFGVAESPLRLVSKPIERRELANGSQLFAVSGQVVNPAGTRQRVPDIRADLLDGQGRTVFTWTITPQQRTIGPKGTIDFNSATLDVPASSKQLELSFAGEGTREK